MIIYNPHNKIISKERIQQAEKILNAIPAKYCFITGSFLYKEKYKDIDVFVITRIKKNIQVEDKKVKITIIDFNDLYSLFYHSFVKCCVAKEIVPQRPLKVTLADYWHIINEAIPVILNQKNKWQKEIRFLVLYTEFFKTGNILDTVELSQKIGSFKDYKEILGYVQKEIPQIMRAKSKPSYLKRFFYTQAGFYKGLAEYKAQSFLYNLTHQITRGIANG